MLIFSFWIKKEFLKIKFIKKKDFFSQNFSNFPSNNLKVIFFLNFSNGPNYTPLPLPPPPKIVLQIFAFATPSGEDGSGAGRKTPTKTKTKTHPSTQTFF